MMTTMPGFHPQMGHPGGPGHPMAPGMPQNPSQQGGPNGGVPHHMAQHMAVSAPGGQMNPAMMGVMPPGVGAPNAHFAHMNPNAQVMQQHFMNNPMAAQQQMEHQRRLIQQQQQRQVLLQQGYQNMNGMPMHMMQQMSQLTPQQIAQLQGMRRAAPNPALMQQMAAMQQAQAQAQHNQHMHAGNGGHGVPMNIQQIQQAQLALQNQMVNQQNMQQHPPQQPQGQPPQPQQPPGQAPGQPGPPQQGQPGPPGQGPQPQHHPQPPQPPQQPSQAGTPAPTVGSQTPAQTPGPTPATLNQPQQAPQPQPQPQAQPQPPHPQMGHPQQMGQQMGQHMGHLQQQASANMLALQQQQQQLQRKEQMKGQCLLKLMQFSEHLSGYPGPKGKEDLSYWIEFVRRFFSSSGVFRHSLHISDGSEPSERQYEITSAALARYFHTHFDSGVRSMQLILDKGTTDRPMPGDCHLIENSRASLVYWFETGSHLVASGSLRAQFDAEQKFEFLEFNTHSHEEFVPRNQVIEAAKPAHNWFKEWHKANSQDNGRSPEMSKKGKGRTMKSPQSAPPEVLGGIPESAVTHMGVTEAVFQFLEIVEVMGQMNHLFSFSHTHPSLSPNAALDQYVATHIINNPQPMANGQPGPQVNGPRTPGFAPFPVGASPAAAHLQLPGSPHIGSPAAAMQAPAMQLQQSQQGTSSSNPSATTSPASNKRRRPSTVKMEEDMSAAPTPATMPGGATPVVSQINGVPGAKSKQPPTPRMGKRLKQG